MCGLQFHQESKLLSPFTSGPHHGTSATEFTNTTEHQLPVIQVDQITVAENSWDANQQRLLMFRKIEASQMHSKFAEQC